MFPMTRETLERWYGRVRRAVGALRRRAARHPRVALVVAACLPIWVLMGVLAVDVFYAIPWPVRKGFGWFVAVAFAALGLARLLTVRPGDRWLAPVSEEGPGAGPSRSSTWLSRSSTWLPLALAAATTLVGWPLLQRPDGIGEYDWIYYTGHFEALRRSVLEWGQFPWWHPWSCGGFPLAGNPQVGVLSPDVPLVLAFGPTIGVRLATVGWLILAAEGARRLAMPWVREPWAAVAAGVIYALNGGVILGVVCGYYIPASFWLVPWLILEVQHLGGHWTRGLRLGAWMALAALTMIHYMTVFAVLVAFFGGLRTLRMARPSDRPAVVLQAIMAAGLVLAVSGWRLATTAIVCADFPRSQYSPGSLSPWHAVECWLTRPDAVELTTTSHLAWESNNYVGPVVLALFIASFRWGVRWWHWLAGITYALAYGGNSWYQPSYWLSHLPLFETMHVVTRWRLVTMLAVGLAAADVLARMRGDPRRWVRASAVGLVVLIGADFVAYSFRVVPLSFRNVPGTYEVPGPPTGGIVQLRAVVEELPAVRRGYGVIEAYEPQLSYRRDRPNARLWRGHPEYKGEHWTDDGPVRPTFWSPNRIVLQVEPGQLVRINQTPGSWWLVNGRRAFADLRVAAMTEPFEARADDRGRLELRIVPRGLGLGLALHLLGASVLLPAAALAAREDARRRRAGLGSPGGMSAEADPPWS